MTLFLNTIKPAPGSKSTSKRLGRGIGSGWGKTAGRGHKGQHARSGGFHKLGFEGGQSPLHRRLKKFGFHSMLSEYTQEIRLSTLEKLKETVVNYETLKTAGLLRDKVKKVKIIATGQITKSIVIQGLQATAGARAAIESAGGSLEN